MKDPLKGRSHVIQGLEQLRESMRIPASNGRKSDGEGGGFYDLGDINTLVIIFRIPEVIALML